jgi:hypothetical protein
MVPWARRLSGILERRRRDGATIILSAERTEIIEKIMGYLPNFISD